MENHIAVLQKRFKDSFAKLLGVTFTEATPECVKAELQGRDELTTAPGRVHGGVIMAFADTLGAAATILNLPEGAGTTTIESKTNFFRKLDPSEKAYGESIPLHIGRSTMVWQTRITREDGKLAALVTQTQMVLTPR